MEPTEQTQPDLMAHMREWAERYLEMGWSILPISLESKRPAIKWTHLQDAPPSEEEVASWFEDGVPDGRGGITKSFNLGLVTGKVSGVVVLDCDNAEAHQYAVGEAGLFSMLGVKTTRGCHLYFGHPGSPVQNKVGGQGRDWPELPGLDMRGDGGYVVLPPSVKFDQDGAFKHSYAWTVPEAMLQDEVWSLARWPGIKVTTAGGISLPQVSAEEWSFDLLQLSNVRSYGASTWDDAGERVKKLGRKMVDGDGRNNWLTRYVGECVASAMTEDQAKVAVDQFQAEFFDQPLPVTEVAATLESIFTRDRRNHPEKYEAAPGYVNQTPERAARAAALRLITPKNLAELKRKAAGQKWLIDPFVPPASIVQLAGFNGHGKSLLALKMLYAASTGQSFGPGVVRQSLRTLYMDFESSGATAAQRLEDCATLFGDMSDAFAMWISSVSDLKVDLNEAEGIKALQDLINEHAPQIVVIDTVRSAWPGMEENSPHSWLKVNQLALAIRNAGMTCILIHHRNKPNMNGMGSSAGSTAQLKDLDQQVFITKIVEDEEQARREAAMPDSATSVLDGRGKQHTAWGYLRASMPAGYKLTMAFEMTFGKQRTATENHVISYVGVAHNTTTGEARIVSTLTPRQKAEALHTRGKTLAEMVDLLQVPLPIVTRWVNDYIEHGKAA